MAGQSSRWRRILRAIFGKTGGNIASVLLLGALGYGFFFSGLHFFLVPSESMVPTLLKSDYLVTTTETTYRRGDIVVLDDPEDPGERIVKRIIAMGGETVAVAGGIVWIDGKPLREPYIEKPPRYHMFPVTIPDACVFVLGDNRNNSQDSHAWKHHWQSADRIVGKVRFIYSPLSRFGFVDDHTNEPPG